MDVKGIDFHRADTQRTVKNSDLIPTHEHAAVDQGIVDLHITGTPRIVYGCKMLETALPVSRSDEMHAQ